MLASRLRLIELIEREGYHAYHLAEHHSTPLGMASSPSVFLAAAIARTQRIRLGPLVYVLPLYQPLRLYEEICMLDHLSGGRLMVGVGRGGALLEHQRYGVDPAAAPAMYHEAFAVLMRAFDSEVVDFDGTFYHYKDYVVQAKPVQRPHPPLWYGAPNAEAIGWAAPRGINVVSLGPAARARAISERYTQEWRALGREPGALPMIGITRHIVVAETDAQAQRIAAAAYARWRDAMDWIWRRAGADFTLKEIYPADFAGPHGHRPRRRRIARDGARLCRAIAGRIRDQLPPLSDGVRRYDRGRCRTLTDAVRTRGDAGFRRLKAVPGRELRNHAP